MLGEVLPIIIFFYKGGFLAQSVKIPKRLEKFRSFDSRSFSSSNNIFKILEKFF